MRNLQGLIIMQLRCAHLAAPAGLLLVCGVLAVAVSPAQSARPPVQIFEQPPASWSHPEAVFRWRSRTLNTACRRDTLRYRPCRGVVKYSGMRPGKHVFVLRARMNGRTTYVRRHWTVVKDASTLQQAPAPPPGVNAAALSRNPNRRNRVPRKLIFSDEFDGTAVNTAAWRPYVGPGHARNGLRDPSALTLDGRGNLVITARNSNGQTIAGGMAARTDFTYGRVEFRVRTEPDPTGVTSGVVLTWPQKQWSPEYTENDMYETGPRKNNRRRFESFIHFGLSQQTQKLLTHETDPSQWHTIAMEWYPRLQEIYVDGQLRFSIGDPGVIPDILHHVCIQLDARSKRALKKPIRMFVDYVRVYQ